MIRDAAYRERVAKELLSTEETYVSDLSAAVGSISLFFFFFFSYLRFSFLFFYLYADSLKQFFISFFQRCLCNLFQKEEKKIILLIFFQQCLKFETEMLPFSHKFEVQNPPL